MKKLIYILCFIVFLISCQKLEDRICYKSTGKTISELRALENFTVLVLTDNIELRLHQSIENSATITAGNNLINFIQTKVSGDTLYISNQNKCNNLRSRKKEVIVTVNVLNIQKIIGKKPVFASGNSDGDLQMLEWTDSNSYKSFKLYLHHTDSVREWAYDRDSHIGRLDKGLDQAIKDNWTVINMKDDWNVIYPYQKNN